MLDYVVLPDSTLLALVDQLRAHATGTPDDPMVLALPATLCNLPQ